MRSSVVIALALLGVLAGPLVAYADTAATPSGLVNVELKDVPVKQAIDTLFEGQGLKYYIQPGVKGRIVELKLKGITFDEALSALGGAVGFSYRIDDGAYVISPGKAKTADKAATAQAVTASPPDPARYPDPGPARGQQMPPPPQVIVNNNFSVPPPTAYAQPAGDGGYPYPPFYNIGGTAYQGGYYPAVNLGSGPYVFGHFPQPPPPPGWVSSDAERLLRFQYSVPRVPGYIAPYPYFRP
jgi:hypothetical protein